MNHPPNLDQVPDHLKIQGNKWHAILNPSSPRSLDIQLLHTSEFEDYFPTCIQFSPDDSLLATGYGDCIRLYDAADFEVVCELQHDPDEEEEQHVINDYDAVRCLCFFPDGKRLAVGYERGTIRLWDIGESVSWVTLRGHEDVVGAIAVSPDAEVMISGAHDGGLFLWDIQSQRRVRSTSVDERGVRGLVMSPDGSSVAAAVGSNVQVFNVPSLQLLGCLPGGHESYVVCVAYSPRGDRLASASVDKTCKNFAMSVCWSSCGRWLISSSKDYTFKIWDSQTGVQQMSVKAHKNTVIAVCASHRDRRLVTAGGDRLLRVWRHIPRVTGGDAEGDLCRRFEGVEVSSGCEGKADGDAVS
ncbi:hypothetical protein CP532_1803 [Ophiocordyceps camponoti-leonardi (nom. inval.)]|nr:hypothetical protein CP532_1803 [Ophiocordyceps camponoti-leonardi (nom. inval.)]